MPICDDISINPQSFMSLCQTVWEKIAENTFDEQIISPNFANGHRIKISNSPGTSSMIDQSIPKVSSLYVERSRGR